MAFQQPQQRPQAPRQLSFSKTVQEIPATQSAIRKRSLEESQEWILFSPTQQGDPQSSTSQTPRTATHLSDFGSLETHVRSPPVDGNVGAGEATGRDTELDDDDGADLDSLDDGLHAFHHHPFSSSSFNQLDQSGGTVLPTHDGLGTFPSSAGLQEHLWQFERHNPHRKRHVRQRSILQQKFDNVEEEQDHEHDAEDERTARIEKWRLDQSKAVLEEIDRETRRRRRRISRMSVASASIDASQSIQQSDIVDRKARLDSLILQEMAPPTSEVQGSSESWWQRITRRVIHDLIGLDENTLSVIFGEELAVDPSPTPTQTSPLAAAATAESRVTFRDQDRTWEAKLLDRIAKELGVLIHQLSEHDGAFSTYLPLYEEPDYAGMPVPRLERKQPLHQRRRQLSDHALAAQSDSLFDPTISQTPASPTEADTSLWGIEEESSRQPHTASTSADALRREQEYWERNLDVHMIFSYLKRCFSIGTTTRAPPPTTPAEGPLPASWTTSASALGTSPESLRRAELIRRQHPLVSRAAERAAAQSRRRESLLRRHHLQTLIQRRTGSSSCASQSTKRTRHTKSGSYSERHYWDLGGSVGSVASGAALSNSAVGGWGEV